MTRRPRRLSPAPALLAGAVLCSCASEPTEKPPSAPSVLTPAPPTPRSTEPWSFQGAEGRIVTTPNYRLFTTVPRGSLLDRAPEFLEAAHARYTSALALLPASPQPLDTFLFAERWQWERFTQQFMGPSAGTYLQIRRGGFAAGGTGVYYDIGPHDTLAIAAHEGWHQFTQRTFAEPLPVWLEEGIACWMEGFRADGGGPARFLPWANVERFDRLRDAASAGRLMSLRDLLDATPEDLLARSTDATLDWYAQVWALVHFLEGSPQHRPGLESLLLDSARGSALRHMTDRAGPAAARRAARSRTGATHFRVYIDADADGAGRAYAAFLARVVRTGSKDRIVQGLPPL